MWLPAVRQEGMPPADSAIEEIVCSFLEHVVECGRRPVSALSARRQAGAARQYADQRLRPAQTTGPGRARGPPAAPQRRKSERRLEIPPLSADSSDEEGGPRQAAATTIQRAWRRSVHPPATSALSAACPD